MEMKKLEGAAIFIIYWFELNRKSARIKESYNKFADSLGT